MSIDKGYKIMNKKSIVLGIISLLLAIGVGVYAAVQTDSNRQSAHKQEGRKVNKSVSGIYDINLTEEEFRDRYNSVINTEFPGMSLNLKKAPEYHGVNANVYEYHFMDALSMMVSYYPDTYKVKGVILTITSTDEVVADRMLSAMVALVITVSPDLTADGKRELFQNMGMFQKNHHTDYKTIDRSTTHNGITYLIKGSGGNGVGFFIRGKDVQLGGESVNDPHDLLADLAQYLTWSNSNSSDSITSNYNNTMIQKYVHLKETYDGNIVAIANQCNQSPSREKAKFLHDSALKLHNDIEITKVQLMSETDIDAKVKDMLSHVLESESERAYYLSGGLLAVSLGQDPLPDYKSGGIMKDEYDLYNQKLQALLK